jgi:membrane protein YqaA with SNARE-associated domain
MRGLIGKDGQRLVAPPKLPKWLAQAIASLGGVGLLIVSFFDSSVLSFPFVADLMVIEFSIHHRSLMLYYVAMATLGSLAGCVWLYLLAKKGGEAYYRRREHSSPGKIRVWVSKHSFLSVFVPALFPPPMPFKAFVLAEGMFQVPLRTFVFGILCGRGLRFVIEGLFAFRYGAEVETFMLQRKLLLVAVPISLITIATLISHWLFRASREPGQD